MESLARQAEQLAVSITDATRSTEHYRAVKTERDNIEEKLAVLGAGEEVVVFLMAVAGRFATLAHVTEEVREWLDERDSLGRFDLRL